jgi:hypothetical protein
MFLVTSKLQLHNKKSNKTSQQSTQVKEGDGRGRACKMGPVDDGVAVGVLEGVTL